MPQWTYNNEKLVIKDIPFYWRVKANKETKEDTIPSRMNFSFELNNEFGFLQYIPNSKEKNSILQTYESNENIGFLKQDSGQLNTYGSSSNNFFLKVAQKFQPKNILDIGCGAGLSLLFLQENGFKNLWGIDPSIFAKQCSEKYKFNLIHDFFPNGVQHNSFEFIICNDLYEHIFDVYEFSKQVFNVLKDSGVFCISTTNSTDSIKSGDISILEHQHVNMFTETSIISILTAAGFGEIKIYRGSYGNTLQIVAIKNNKKPFYSDRSNKEIDLFFKKATHNIEKFSSFYTKYSNIGFYVPLRCFGYLACVKDYSSNIYDSNSSWHNKYVDGYESPILNPKTISNYDHDIIFIGSLTFFDEIRKFCREKNIKKVVNINELT